MRRGCLASFLSLCLLCGAAQAQAVNHALQLDWDGSADTGVSVEALARADFTLAARVSLEHPNGDYGWLFGEAGEGTFLAGKDSARGRFLLDFGGGPQAFDFALRARTWTHFAVVVRGGTAQVFRDGVGVHTTEVPRSADAGEAESSVGARGTLRLGRRNDSFPGEQWVGFLDDIYVLEGALSAQEVKALSARGAVPPAEARVLAGYSFEPLAAPGCAGHRDAGSSAAPARPRAGGGCGPSLPALRGEARVVEVDLEAPTPPLQPNHRTALRLPFQGEWVVTQGPESGPTHFGPEAFAYDFVPIEERLAATARDPRVPQQWPCFGRPVLAPAEGRITAVVSDRPDGPDKAEDDLGNLVLLEHAPGELSELLHLKQHSVRVKVGQRVRQGEQLAECGNSGRSSSPHLHWALLRTVERRAVSRPSVFRDTWVPVFQGGRGRWERGDGVLSTGARVHPAVRGRAPPQAPTQLPLAAP